MSRSPTKKAHAPFEDAGRMEDEMQDGTMPVVSTAQRERLFTEADIREMAAAEHRMAKRMNRSLVLDEEKVRAYLAWQHPRGLGITDV